MKTLQQFESMFSTTSPQFSLCRVSTLNKLDNHSFPLGSTVASMKLLLLLALGHLLLGVTLRACRLSGRDIYLSHQS